MFFRCSACSSSLTLKAKKEETELPWKIASTKPSKRARIKSFFSSGRKSKKASYSKRQNIIYTQDREVTLVHFIYSGSTDLNPVVAKQKNRKPDLQVDSEAIKEQFKDNRSDSNNREASWYLAAALALILLLVVLFGKPFAIFCCSVFWYLVPALRGNQSMNDNKNFQVG